MQADEAVPRRVQALHGHHVIDASAGESMAAAVTSGALGLTRGTRASCQLEPVPDTMARRHG